MKKLRNFLAVVTIFLIYVMAYVRSFCAKSKTLTMGIIVEEFFHEQLRGFGGFGMTVKNISDYYNSRPDMKIRVNVLLSSQLPIAPEPQIKRFHNADVLFRSCRNNYPNRDLIKYLSLFGSKPSRFFITVEYHPSYNYILKAIPWVPVIIYIRDPKGKEEWQRLASVSLELKQRHKDSVDSLLKLADEKAQAIAEIIKLSKTIKRKIIFATNAPFLVDRAKRAYGLNDIHPYLLRNPLIMPKLDETPCFVKPSLCFIGRLDSQKRFWMTFELARRFKNIDFYICGASNDDQIMGPIINKYKDCENLKMLGVVDGQKKWSTLRGCWGLINTSIHEGLPVTFLEACTVGKSIISCLDPDGLVSRFGYYTGDILGEGLDQESLDKFSRQIERFLSNGEERNEKGRLARKYVEENHSFENFHRQLRDIVAKEKL